jgi:hypothetical protein
MEYPVWLRIVALLFSAAAFADQPQRGNLRLSKHVLAGGGEFSSSQVFRMHGVMCPSTPVGVSSDNQFFVHAGYMEPTFQVSPLSPIQDLVIERLPATGYVHLSWAAVPSAAYYVIYRDSYHDFVPGPASRIATTSSNSFTDVNTLALPARTYFYVVTWVSTQDQ